ncbi:hypothetical protein [Kistimonas asteriae]|uniref:hypothetical protein n=1 Tax=Kistimonas asteriae TaxID=517724 RepID=UPI001BA84085|nr:hypothetical protein [Kistimonas asteriae]
MINNHSSNLKFKLAWKTINNRRMFEIKPVNTTLPVTYLGSAQQIRFLPSIIREIVETIQATNSDLKNK